MVELREFVCGCQATGVLARSCNPLVQMHCVAINYWTGVLIPLQPYGEAAHNPHLHCQLGLLHQHPEGCSLGDRDCDTASIRYSFVGSQAQDDGAASSVQQNASRVKSSGEKVASPAE